VTGDGGTTDAAANTEPRTGPRAGPLAGVTVVELGGIGPLPLFAMLFADLGARVIRVDPAGPASGAISSHLWIFRGQESVTVDLRQPRGQELVLALVERADVLVEGYRPGVAERLGVGPDACLTRNSRLVYGRMTGWGEGGPLSDRGGHDINYIGLTGALAAMGPPDAPPPVPLNLVGDFGGGAMMLALGVLAALHERQESGRGQVVEAAMSDGTLALMALFYAMRDAGHWVDARGANQPQGFAPYYRCYETADGQYMAVGAVEAKFYAALLDGLGFDPALAETQQDRARWPELMPVFEDAFRAKTRAEWEEVFATRDACVTPVLSMAEAPAHPHHAARDCFVEANGRVQVAPPVRFGRTPGTIGGPAPDAGADNARVLAELGVDADELAWLRADGVVG
jgi:alpha-methylacyl-CoA racemase